MTKAKRRITKFNFESEGAHCALVTAGANQQTVLTMKALDPEEPSQNLSSSVESQDGDVVKAEDEKLTNKGIESMSKEKKEMSAEELQTMINKAAEDIVKERLETLEKQYADKDAERNKELEVLKAAEEARTSQVYLTKAEKVSKYLGEETDKEALAKSLRKAEMDEELAPLMKAFGELQDTVSKEELLVEKGVSATSDQPNTEEAKIEELAKSYQKEEGLSAQKAYMKAYEEVKTA